MAEYPDLSGNTPPVVIRDLVAQPVEIAGGIYQEVPVTLEDGQTGRLLFDSAGRLVTSVGGSALPSGAATAARQDTTNAALAAGVKSLNSNGFAAGNDTYVASVPTYTAYATPTDMFTLSGSATKIVIPVYFGIIAVQTTAALQTVYFIKRSALNTGGTSAAATPMPLDSDSAAATAVLRSWTVIPAGLGAAVGEISRQTLSIPAATSAPTGINLFNISAAVTAASLHTGPILRNENECIAFNWNGAALPAGFTGTIYAVWVEI